MAIEIDEEGFAVESEEPEFDHLDDNAVYNIKIKVIGVGGGGVPAMENFPREYLVERIRFHARKPFPAETLEVIFTEDEEDKTVQGAALYAASKR